MATQREPVAATLDCRLLWLLVPRTGDEQVLDRFPALHARTAAESKEGRGRVTEGSGPDKMRDRAPDKPAKRAGAGLQQASPARQRRSSPPEHPLCPGLADAIAG